MSSIEVDKAKSSWVDQMENEETESSSPVQVEVAGDTKIVTGFTYIEGVKYKVVRHYRVEKRKVPVAVAKRKTWAKFGQCKDDLPGPNLATTIIQDEVQMKFLNCKEEETKVNKDVVNSFGGNQAVQCRNCGHNHWTLNCPYKGKLDAINKLAENAGDAKDETQLKPGILGKRNIKVRESKLNEENTIRVTNLPEETQDSDIRDLFSPCGQIKRIYLAKDKITGRSRGFAFVSFESREDALLAIKAVNGHGYNNLILSVDWARPAAD